MSKIETHQQRKSQSAAPSWSLDGQTLRVEHELYEVVLDLDVGVSLREWRTGPNRVSCLAEPAQLFQLTVDSDWSAGVFGTGYLGSLQARSWLVDDVRVEESADGLRAEVTLLPDLDRCHCLLRVSLEFGEGPAWRFALRPDGLGRTFRGLLEFPVLRRVDLGEGMRSLLLASAPARYRGTLPVSLLDGKAVLYASRSAESVLPCVFTDPARDAGVCLAFRRSGFPLLPVPAATVAEARYRVEFGPGQTELVDLEVGHCGGDWKQLYRRWRDAFRTTLRAEQYEREEQRWYRDVFTCSFAFVFSRELYDPERGDYVLDEYLDEMRRAFGGLDAFIFWSSYPLFGIDARNQFEFFDNLPGGREAVRRLFERAREQGTRPFVAYIPVDQIDPQIDHAREFARLCRDVGADGIHLDTMGHIHPAFRRALDEEGLRHVVYLPELRPPLTSRMDAVAESTGSWAQLLPTEMPCIDLFRFVVPEHKVLVVDRVARSRRPLVHTAFFNGNGIVLWDRNFADPEFNLEQANVYSEEDKALIRRCYALWRQHADAFTSPLCEPLVETAEPDLYANLFLAEGKAVYTLYNAGGEPYTGPLLVLPLADLEERFGRPLPDLEAEDAWNGEPAQLERAGEAVVVSGSVAANDLGCLTLRRPQ